MVNCFFKPSINSVTKTSGADAPDEIPIVLQFLILLKGISLSECISSAEFEPFFFCYFN